MKTKININLWTQHPLLSGSLLCIVMRRRKFSVDKFSLYLIVILQRGTR